MSETNVEDEVVVEEKVEEKETEIVSFDEEVKEEGNQDSSVIKDLRKRNKEQNRELSELRKAQVKTEVETPLGARPTLEDADYDEDLYSNSLDVWLTQKSEIDTTANKRQQAADDETSAWNKRLDEYNVARKDFGDTFEEAEDAVKAELSETQQGMLVHALGGDLAEFVATLGISPKRLKKLAKIKDHTLFALEIGRLDARMKTAPRKAKTVPESRVVGDGGGIDISGDSKLDTLREKAAKTGDYTQVMKHKAKMRRASET